MMTAVKLKNILVVDDNPGDLCLFRIALEQTEGIELHAVTSVLQARAFLRRTRPFEHSPVPDLLFLDLRMPIYSGHALLRFIKTDSELRHLTVVVFTSSPSYLDMKQCKELGADDYVVKPLDWTEWQAAIMAAVTKHVGVISPPAT